MQTADILKIFAFHIIAAIIFYISVSIDIYNISTDKKTGGFGIQDKAFTIDKTN